MMQQAVKLSQIIGWAVGMIVLAAGVLNLFLVHPVPGIIYLLLSLVYLPPANTYLKRRLNLSIPFAVKLALGVLLFFFTFGVSDLGDMIDKL